jgi:hypothetical protein
MTANQIAMISIISSIATLKHTNKINRKQEFSEQFTELTEDEKRLAIRNEFR